MVKPNNIVVKTERQVENILGIKREHEIHNKIPKQAQSSNNTTSRTVKASQSDKTKWMDEKQSLIEKIAALKSQNQQTLFDLKKTQNELEIVNNDKRMLTEKLIEKEKSHTNQLNTLQTEVASVNTARDKMKNDNLKRIAELTRERDLLRAQFKQLQNGFNRQSAAENENKADECGDEQYEVESLLDDQFISVRQFLVRWKGYDSQHDSWVFETDLNCPRMLRKYDQSKKKK